MCVCVFAWLYGVSGLLYILVWVVKCQSHHST